MAITTSNLGLRKPAKTDYVNVATDLNGNMDIIDSSVNAVENSVAIISNGNTHVAVSSGEYLYVRNHSSLTEGLYKATAAISQNGTLSSSNVSAVSKGIGSQVAALNDKVSNIYTTGSDSITTALAVANAVSTHETGSITIVRTSAASADSFVGSSTYAATLLVYKASSNNAYFFAFTRTNCAIGNLALSDGTITKVQVK